MLMPLHLCPPTFIPLFHPLYNCNEHIILFVTAKMTERGETPNRPKIILIKTTLWRFGAEMHYIFYSQMQFISVTYSELAPRSASIVLLCVRMIWFRWRVLVCLLQKAIGIRNIHRFQKIEPAWRHLSKSDQRTWLLRSRLANTSIRCLALRIFFPIASCLK